MSTTPIPHTERQRLATLHALQILDTPPEERFDRITRLATQFFDVPIALVSFVDEHRQWFKSVQGLAFCETSRESSFCAHAILEQNVLVVPDALLDPRFCENPLVQNDPQIRFYVGCPIRALDGSALGALCLIDRQPRHLTPSDLHALQDLASWVEHEINTVQISGALLQRENEVRLRAMMESTSEGMVLLSPEQRFLIINRGFSTLFGLAADQVVGQCYATLLPAMERLFAPSQRLQQVFPGLADDDEQQVTMFVRQCSPQPRDLELFSAPVRTATQEHLGRLYVFRDVTHERELERMKSEFVTQVSHELRTPLTLIQGYLELLLPGHLGAVSPPQQEALTVMAQHVEHLGRLVSDLLDFSRLESGQMTLQRSRLDLLPLLQHAIDSLAPQISKKQQTLTLWSPVALPTVLVDPDRFTQVLLNLLTNAHQYTPAGGQIQVRTAVEDGCVRIEVEDTGRGLSPEEQAQVFLKFYRAQPCSAELGTGLGLTIARTLVELHGGSIAVASSPGQGSTFTVRLPTVEQGGKKKCDAPQ